MSLLVQTHAPMKTRARALYVYACARGCRGDDAWTAVRATGREEEEDEDGQRSNGASVEGKSAGFGTMDVDGRGEETTGVAERAPLLASKTRQPHVRSVSVSSEIPPSSPSSPSSDEDESPVRRDVVQRFPRPIKVTQPQTGEAYEEIVKPTRRVPVSEVSADDDDDSAV